jgi:hypothetical protein
MSHDAGAWPRQPARDCLGSPESMRNVVALATNSGELAKSRAAVALELIERAAEAIDGFEARANETEMRAMAIAREAIDKLSAAEARIQAGEAAHRQVLEEVTRRVETATEELKWAQARIAAVQLEAEAAAARATAAETRAGEAEAALRQLEQAIRTRLLRENALSLQAA